MRYRQCGKAIDHVCVCLIRRAIVLWQRQIGKQLPKFLRHTQTGMGAPVNPADVAMDDTDGRVTCPIIMVIMTGKMVWRKEGTTSSRLWHAVTRWLQHVVRDEDAGDGEIIMIVVVILATVNGEVGLPKINSITGGTWLQHNRREVGGFTFQWE